MAAVSPRIEVTVRSRLTELPFSECSVTIFMDFCFLKVLRSFIASGYCPPIREFLRFFCDRKKHAQTGHALLVSFSLKLLDGKFEEADQPD